MNDETTVNSLLAAFFHRAVRPIARVLLRHGMSYRDISELLKEAYVDIATHEYGDDGKPANVSQVAMLTGMTRRDVRTIRTRDDGADTKAVKQTNSAARVLTGWFQDAAFLDERYEPRPLPDSGPEPSFAALAKRYAPDIPVGTTLNALKAAGAVQYDEASGLLFARSRYYMPGSGDAASPDAVVRSGSVFEDLGNTVNYNLARQSGDPSRFERRATNTHVAPDAVPAFRHFVESEGQAFLERVDAWLTQHEAQNDHDGVRLGLGMFWIQDDQEKTNHD
jgi:hypothetical protein